MIPSPEATDSSKVVPALPLALPTETLSGRQQELDKGYDENNLGSRHSPALPLMLMLMLMRILRAQLIYFRRDAVGKIDNRDHFLLHRPEEIHSLLPSFLQLPD